MDSSSDVGQTGEKSFYFQLSHQDVVVHIHPESYTQCFVAIGKIEVLIPQPILPFKSPAVLNCKIKVIFDKSVDDSEPYIFVNHIDRKIYKLLPLQDVSQEQKHYLENKSPYEAHATPSSTISKSLIKALTSRQPTPEMEPNPITPAHITPNPITPAHAHRIQPSPNLVSQKEESSRCCFLF
jgi:hypothetical protein